MAHTQSSISQSPADLRDRREASRLGVFLGFYLDYLLLGVIFEIAWYVAFGSEFSFWIKVGVLTLSELVIFRWLGSPGFYFLGITAGVDNPKINGYNPLRERTFVSPHSALAQSGWLVFLGILFVLSGAKEMVRWTMWAPAWPFFGIAHSTFVSVSTSLVSGLAAIATGYYILQLRKAALYLAWGNAVFGLIAQIPGWDLWDEAAAEYATRRHEYFGKPIRPGEIEFMQAVTPEVMIGVTILFAVSVTLGWKRLCR